MAKSILICLIWIGLQPNPIVGKWISVDDATGKEKSEISLYLQMVNLW